MRPNQPAATGPFGELSSSTVGLLKMLAAAAACGTAAIVVKILGVFLVAFLTTAGGILLAVLLAWSWALWRAPVLVKHATVLLFFGTFAAALLPCWLQRSREDARRLQTSNQLRRLGLELHAQHALHPQRTPRQFSSEWREFMLQHESVVEAADSPRLTD